MPLFEVEDGRRAEPVATAPPDDASFADALSVVLDHLPALLGERLFMTATGVPEQPEVQEPSGPEVLALGEPVVLAIDAAGAPVVVQAVPVLDGPGLVVALRAAGRAARTARGTIAATYASGPDRFHQDLAAFFDRDLRPRAPDAGRPARLVLVCAEIDDDTLDAVAFVSTDARHVQVVTVGTVSGPSGRELLDVSTLRPGELAARRTVSIELDGAREDLSPVLPDPPPVLSSGPGQAAGTVVGDAYVPLVLDTSSLVALPARPSDLPSLPDVVSAPSAGGVDLSRPAPARQPVPAEASIGCGPAHVRLDLLARTLSAPVDLVWVRHRRGERHEVVLGLDGLLSAPDGTRFGDPDHAARTLAGSEATDGWRVWRAGEHGPSLDEMAPSRPGQEGPRPGQASDHP